MDGSETLLSMFISLPTICEERLKFQKYLPGFPCKFTIMTKMRHSTDQYVLELALLQRREVPAPIHKTRSKCSL